MKGQGETPENLIKSLDYERHKCCLNENVHFIGGMIIRAHNIYKNDLTQEEHQI